MFSYKTRGTCSQLIEFEIDGENKLRNVRCKGGCKGNLQGIARLAEGKDADEVAALLKGTQCRGGTSCPDQLAKAIEAYKQGK